MASPRDVRSFSIHFDREGQDDHVLPAHVLIESLDKIQRIVLLLAKMHRGEQLGQRIAFSQELRDEFALLCYLPEPGSYALPIEVGGESGAAAQSVLNDVCQLFHRVSRAVGDAGADLHQIVPDPRYRSALAGLYRKAQPSPKSGVSLSIEDHRRRRLLDGRRPLHGLDEAIPLARTEPISATTISGLLTGMDFHRRSIRLMRLDGKTITVSYDDDDERPLLDHRRGWITVKGNVVYDSNRRPLSVKHAHDFATLDDGIELAELWLDDGLYHANPPLRFDVTYDADDELFDLEGDFEISLSAGSRPKLLRELNEVLSMLWLDYAQEEPDRLSPRARNLRAELLARLQAA